MNPSARRMAVDDYLKILEESVDLLPDLLPLPYDPVSGIDGVNWRLPFIERMVEGELQDLTNQLNAWKSSLRRWHAWNKVLLGKDEDARWAIEWEFVESIAFMNMFQPSSIRDCIGFVATNALHQILMVIDPTRKDALAGDPKNPGKSTRRVGRTEKEIQLAKMVKAWPEGQYFMGLLQSIDDDAYEDVTKDFRNRASHAIAPRFTFGEVGFVTRRSVQKMTLEIQSDGLWKEVAVPGKLSVVYGFGGTPPLDMATIWAVNLEQFNLARQCFDAYVSLLAVAISDSTK